MVFSPIKGAFEDSPLLIPGFGGLFVDCIESAVVVIIVVVIVVASMSSSSSSKCVAVLSKLSLLLDVSGTGFLHNYE